MQVAVAWCGYGTSAVTYATQIACTRSSGIAVRNALDAISMPGRPRLPNSSSM